MNDPFRKESSKSSFHFMFVVGALLALGCSQAAASEPDAPGRAPLSESQIMEDIQALKEVEQIWVKSLTDGDAKLLGTIIDREFTFIGPDAQVEAREAYLAGYEAMPQLGVVVEGIDMSDLQFRVLEEVGIVTGRVVARVKMQGNPLVEDVRFTRVYRRTSQGWKMIAGQGTRIPEAAPSDQG